VRRPGVRSSSSHLALCACRHDKAGAADEKEDNTSIQVGRCQQDNDAGRKEKDRLAQP
jgi:hypothetical protein